MIRKVLNILLIIATPAALIMLLGFAVEQNKQLPCNKLSIQIDYRCGHHFINAEEVKSKILNSIGNIEGKPFSNGLLSKIESIVSDIPSVQKTDVFRQINGNLHINITQRQPVLRVINAQNQSYYIDRAGHLMPVSSDYTARVLVATGNIHAGYSQLIDLSKTDDEEELSSNYKRLRNLYFLAAFIENNPFWSAFIDHVYVTENGQFELTPKNGAHIIEFGSIDQMQQKFRKLMVFYQNGLTQTGWNHYKRINVKFSNQVICSK